MNMTVPIHGQRAGGFVHVADPVMRLRLRLMLAAEFAAAGGNRKALVARLREKGFDLAEGEDGPIVASWPTGGPICPVRAIWPGPLTPA